MTKYQNQSIGQCLGMCKGVVDYSGVGEGEGGGGGGGGGGGEKAM